MYDVALRRVAGYYTTSRCSQNVIYPITSMKKFKMADLLYLMIIKYNEELKDPITTGTSNLLIN